MRRVKNSKESMASSRPFGAITFRLGCSNDNAPVVVSEEMVHLSATGHHFKALEEGWP